ncbi:TIGR04282 family arsenosugar biosynthesis glycosyltransferase [Lentzea sp. CA-135723]|uniref:TIGR04282 family arsenosugar biosynthesis glycosyltransferase n=1 Tax=Lentzea sp. CA-135723 TaxID=3239950 RepID=UPI003D8F3D7D
MRFSLMIMAKSPIPGQVKTRLCPPLSPEEAADVAAASLLDTVAAALETPGAVPVVALAGVVRREDVRDALAECVVIPQRGSTFAERLVHAHADVARFRMPVLQIGMDTPQVTPSLLESCAEFGEAALGFAQDGGWWALGLRDPLRAAVLRDVPMSRADTGVRTLEALLGMEVRTLPVLSDVDTIEDAVAVAREVPGSRFAAAVAAVGRAAGQVSGGGAGRPGAPAAPPPSVWAAAAVTS